MWMSGRGEDKHALAISMSNNKKEDKVKEGKRVDNN